MINKQFHQSLDWNQLADQRRRSKSHRHEKFPIYCLLYWANLGTLFDKLAIYDHMKSTVVGTKNVVTFTIFQVDGYFMLNRIFSTCAIFPYIATLLLQSGSCYVHGIVTCASFYTRQSQRSCNKTSLCHILRIQTSGSLSLPSSSRDADVDSLLCYAMNDTNLTQTLNVKPKQCDKRKQYYKGKKRK